MYKRKGQFFIMGAIIVVASIYAISSILNETWSINSSELQKDNTIWLFKNIEKDVHKTLEITSDNPEDIETNLNDLIIREKEMLPSQMDIGIKYDYSSTNEYIEIIIYISREDTWFEKNVTTNIACLKADPSSERCNNLAAPLPDKTICCKNFNLCCL